MYELTYLTERVNGIIEKDDEFCFVDSRRMKQFLIEEYGEKILKNF